MCGGCEPGRASRHWSAAVRLPQVFDERLCGIACVGNGRGERGSCGVDGHYVHQGRPRLRIVHARPLPTRPCAPPANPPEPPCSPEGAEHRGRRAAPVGAATGSSAGGSGSHPCVGPALRTAPSIRRSAQRETSSLSRSKSILAGVDIRCLSDYGFFCSQDRARPGRHELPGRRHQDRPGEEEVRPGTAGPDWKVVPGHASAIPAAPPSQAEPADIQGRRSLPVDGVELGARVPVRRPGPPTRPPEEEVYAPWQFPRRHPSR